MTCQQPNGPVPPHDDTAWSPDPGPLTDADLEQVGGGKALPRGEIEGSNGWYVRLPSKLRR